MSRHTNQPSQLRDATSARVRAARSTFRFRDRWVHLTYKNHIDKAQLKALFEHIGDGLVTWSICHEQGHGAPGDDGSHGDLSPYEHTHAFFEWNKALDTTNARFFDIVVPTDRTRAIGRFVRGMATGSSDEHIHPHVQRIKNSEHANNIFTTYHHKEDTAPEQSDVAAGRAATIYDRIRATRSLAEACELVGIDVGTLRVNELKLLREDSTDDGPFEHIYPDAHWSLRVEFSRVLFLWGRSQTGKTQWALSQFRNPLLVSDIEDLRQFNATRHDGIVFDDMSFAHWPRTSCIHLLDWDMDRTIHMRYKNPKIPKHTRKIFTSNLPWQQVFPEDVYEAPATCGAIRERISKIVKVSGPTFYPAGTGPGDHLDDTADEEEKDPDNLEGLGRLGSLIASLQSRPSLTQEQHIDFNEEDFEMDLSIFEEPIIFGN